MLSRDYNSSLTDADHRKDIRAMKIRSMTASRFGFLSSLLLLILSGCSLLPPLSPEQAAEDAPPASLELQLGTALPEDIVLTWNPAAVTVNRAEVSVTEGSAGHTVTVTIQLCPSQS